MKRIIVTVLLMLLLALSTPACLDTSEPEITVKIERITVPDENPDEGNDGKGYIYYSVPQEYVMNGGEFSDELQEFTQDLCTEGQLSYPLVLALIEKETGYRNVDPNGCGSTGYMQVIPKWHEERMEKFGVTDLLEPEGNITVGIDYLTELFEKYHETNLVLMAYNMGESGAKRLWKDGMYSSDYADYIMEREAEISLEIYGR